MKRLVFLLFLLAASPALFGQGYDVPDVVISTEKANIAGKRYYLHKVLPKQTVFSICKAYGVTEEALQAANPDLKDGLKAGAILFVPMSEEAVQAEAAARKDAREKKRRQTRQRSAAQKAVMLDAKRRHSAKKSARRPPRPDD